MDGLANSSRERLRQEITTRCIVKGSDQLIVGRDGKALSWLLDLRPVLLDGICLSVIAEEFWNRFPYEGPLQVCGLETASIPLIAAITIEGSRRGYAVNGLIVRKKRKRDGRMRVIEGAVKRTPVVVVDDLLHSGASLLRAISVLRAHNLSVVSAFVIVDFESALGAAALRGKNVRLIRLFSLSEIGLSPRRETRTHTPSEATFEELWSFIPDGTSSYYVVPKSNPVAFEGCVFFGTDRGTFHCVSQQDGAPVWTRTINGCGPKGIWSSPCVFAGSVIFGAYDGNLYRLDARDGAEIWRAEAGDWIGSSPVIAECHGLVLVGLEHAATRQGSVAAFEASDGSKVWEIQVDALVHGSPAYDGEGDRVFIGANDGVLYCLQAANGSLLWRALAGGPIKGRPVIDRKGKAVLVGSFDGCVHAFHLMDGSPKFGTKLGDVVYSNPALAGRRLFASCADKYLHVLDADSGDPIERINLGARMLSPPVLIQGRIYATTNGGKVVEVDPQSLQVTAEHQLTERLTNAVVHGERSNVFFVMSHNAVLTAIARRPVQQMTAGCKHGSTVQRGQGLP